MSIFFLDVTTRLQRVHIFNETKFKIPSIDLYCIKMNLKHFYPSPHLQNCLTSARLKFRKGSGFSGKCQTHLKNFSRQKLSSGWQYCFVFFGFLLNFTKCQTILASARLKALDQSGKCQTQVNISFDMRICARRS